MLIYFIVYLLQIIKNLSQIHCHHDHHDDHQDHSWLMPCHGMEIGMPHAVCQTFQFFVKAMYTTTRVCLYHPATHMWLYPKPRVLDTATLAYKAIQSHTHEYS